MKYLGYTLLVFTVLVNAYFFNKHMTTGNWFTNTPPSLQSSGGIAEQGLAEFVESMKLVVLYHSLELYYLKLFVTFMMDGLALALSFFFISHDSNK